MTIKAPEENTLIYDGSNKKATLENKLLTGENDPTIKLHGWKRTGGYTP